jgi:hypothetical protein
MPQCFLPFDLRNEQCGESEPERACASGWQTPLCKLRLIFGQTADLRRKRPFPLGACPAANIRLKISGARRLAIRSRIER